VKEPVILDKWMTAQAKGDSHSDSNNSFSSYLFSYKKTAVEKLSIVIDRRSRATIKENKKNGTSPLKES